MYFFLQFYFPIIHTHKLKILLFNVVSYIYHGYFFLKIELIRIISDFLFWFNMNFVDFNWIPLVITIKFIISMTRIEKINFHPWSVDIIFLHWYFYLSTWKSWNFSIIWKKVFWTYKNLNNRYYNFICQIHFHPKLSAQKRF